MTIYQAYYVSDGERFAAPCSTLEVAKEYLFDRLTDEYPEQDSDEGRKEFDEDTANWNLDASHSTNTHEYGDFCCWVDKMELVTE